MSVGYRTLPAEVCHPRKYKLLTVSDFNVLEKNKMESAPSACEGHEETVIWFNNEIGYIVQVKIKGKKDYFLNTPCTYTPTFGMDSIDGLFAQIDAEEYILEKELGIKANRLSAFNGKESIEISEYLKRHGIAFDSDSKKSEAKKWWKFW